MSTRKHEHGGTGPVKSLSIYLVVNTKIIIL